MSELPNVNWVARRADVKFSIVYFLTGHDLSDTYLLAARMGGTRTALGHSFISLSSPFCRAASREITPEVILFA